ncbi:hypothetical protein [Streptomyces melanogenes]|uniref:hypothetical protein n=1 Tax=Streptomyces melanogenes TaxID=67326 RepID=UPI00378DA856
MADHWVPTTGTYAVDTTSGRIGEVRKLKDTVGNRVGRMVAWDGALRAVTLAPLEGGPLGDIRARKPPNELDRLRARILRVGQR